MRAPRPLPSLLDARCTGYYHANRLHNRAVLCAGTGEHAGICATHPPGIRVNGFIIRCSSPPPFFFLRTAYLHSVSAGCTTKLLQCPQMKAECQTFEVEGFFFFWHLATPRSLLQSCNGVWTVWGERAAVSGSLLLGERARGTRRPPLSHCTPHPAHFRTRRLAPCGGQS